MAYDSLGHMTQATDPKNQVANLSCNEANQPISISYPGETVSYT